MSRYFNVNGTWHQGGHAWVNINGTWPAIGNMWVNINGVWHALFSYYWSVGGWGGCSATCGGGVQYRDVVCMRNDGWNGGWEGYCTTYVGAKPATSQACNTQSCVSCRYNRGKDYSSCYPGYSEYVTYVVSFSAVCNTKGACPPAPCGVYSSGALKDSIDSPWYYEICGPF